MTQKKQILSISLPSNLIKKIDILSYQMQQKRNNIIIDALSAYLQDMDEEKEAFLKAYAQTRKGKTLTLEEIQEKYHLN